MCEHRPTTKIYCQQRNTYAAAFSTENFIGLRLNSQILCASNRILSECAEFTRSICERASVRACVYTWKLFELFFLRWPQTHFAMVLLLLQMLLNRNIVYVLLVLLLFFFFSFSLSLLPHFHYCFVCIVFEYFRPIASYSSAECR